MSPVDEDKLPKWKRLEECKQGELVRGRFLATTEWAIVGARGNQMQQLVVLTGDRAPYWLNAFNERGMEVMPVDCLSYSTDYRVIPDYLTLVDEGNVGTFVVRQDGKYGIMLNRPPNGRDAGFLNLKTLTVESKPDRDFFALSGWSLWKDKATAKGEPLLLVKFPDKGA
jgi:hypothetical protein